MSADDPKHRGRFSIGDIRAQSRRDRNQQLIRDLEVVLLIWCVGGLLWIAWEWIAG